MAVLSVNSINISSDYNFNGNINKPSTLYIIVQKYKII